MNDRSAYLAATPMQRELVCRFLGDVLAILRAQGISYQTSHWQLQGDNFYGQHLLFDRLYNSVLKQVDELAEKLVGYLGSEAVELSLQVQEIQRICAGWLVVEGHVSRGLRSEQDLQDTISAAYSGIKQAGAMTLGLDDWLMATANAHEENSYLLQQVQSSSLKNASGAPSAEGHFRPNPRKREVHEFARSNAVSNVDSVVFEAVKDRPGQIPDAMKNLSNAPPTPEEITELPDGDLLSTLNRYLVDHENPMQRWAREVRGSVSLHYSRGGVLSWNPATKSFAIDISILENAYHMRSLKEGVTILSPKGGSMFFSNPIPHKDREGEITHWVLLGEKGLKLLVWNT